MSFPNNLKDLHDLCQQNGIKYKGKPKAQLKDLLLSKNVALAEKNDVEDISKLSVKALKERCENLGLSKYGNKDELVKRIVSSSSNIDTGIKVVKWKKRGRKAATRPSETVGAENEESDEDDEPSEYFKMKKHELKEECIRRNLPASGNVKTIINRLKENDALKEEVKRNNPNDDKLCESCEDNPGKLYESPSAKWFCRDCKQHICNLCKDAHEKLKITRSHVIIPFGTILELNIGNDLTIPGEIVEHEIAKNKDVPQFMDISRSDDDEDSIEDTPKKRKRTNDSETDEDENDNSLVYETPLARIFYRRNKRIVVDVIPETPLNVPETPEFIDKTLDDTEEIPIITPPPVWRTPTARPKTSLFAQISPIDENSFSVTYAAESPDRLEISKDMFDESMNQSACIVPETPVLPPNPPPVPTQRLTDYVQTFPITPARLQGQRWRNWGLTRLRHLPLNEVYTDQEVIDNLEGTSQAPNDVDSIRLDDHSDIDTSPALEVSIRNDVPDQSEEILLPDTNVVVEPKKTITAKITQEKKRNLTFKVPEEVKSKCISGKWTYNYQGGETFCVDGFSYLINNHCVSKKTGALTLYLICSKCGGRNILSDGHLKKHDHPGHTCSPDPDNWAILEADLHLKSLAVTTQHPPSRIQNDVLVQAPHEVKKFLPPTKLMKRRINHMRRKHKGAMDDNIEDIKLPNLELPDGSLFNLYDNEKAGDRIMILGARRGLKVVSRSKILLTDGTFKSAPTTIKEKWYQIFVIHAEFMETGEIYPCLFCLMQHRKKENYDEVYKEVKRLIAENGWPFQILSGGKMYMDMEPANKSSVKECLNDPAICVCYFHLSGITNKTVVDLGLKKLVFSSPIFNHHCRMINALATVPLRFVVRAFDKLYSYLQSLNSAALPVLDYWEKNLVKGYMVAETRRTVLPKWKIEEWNIYEKIIKKEETSTCKLEAWHQNLDRLLMKAHPTFEEFCQVLMGEWNKIDFEMDLLESGHTRDQLKFGASTADNNRQKRIFNIAMSVNSYHSIVEYLNAMAVASKK